MEIKRTNPGRLGLFIALGK